ncbi:MAG: hypothetical protein J5809_07675 [Selenomonadaceae bacterium]|nr:hypothetical protein [Selenomonadaceae bacterium]
MKKLFLTVTLLVMLAANVCFAIESDDFGLGDLWLNMPYAEVIESCGQPTSHPGGYAQLVTDVIKYGDDVEIGFLGKKVRYVAVTADNGWETPAGVCVGMSIGEVLEIYGEADEVVTLAKPFDASGEYFYQKWSGTKMSWTHVSGNYMYEPGDTKEILSVIVNGGVVTALELSQRTPEH